MDPPLRGRSKRRSRSHQLCMLPTPTCQLKKRRSRKLEEQGWKTAWSAVRRRATYQIEGRKKPSSAPCTLTNHLLLSELALSLLFALIQVKLTPLADKWTEASHFQFFFFFTHYKNPMFSQPPLWRLLIWHQKALKPAPSFLWVTQRRPRIKTQFVSNRETSGFFGKAINL